MILRFQYSADGTQAAVRLSGRSARLAQLAPDSIAQLVEQLPAIVYLWEAGADGQCYYVSGAIESVLGHPADDWLADPSLWARSLHPEDHDRVIAQELGSRENGTDFAAEYRMFARDGRLVWIRDEAVMIRETEDYPGYLLGLMYDISPEREAQESLRRSHEETIRRLSRAAEFRDDDTGTHIERVSRYCALIAVRLGLDREHSDQLRIASPMHDVGKIGVADAILQKPGPLDATERAAMQLHTEIGRSILAGSGAELLELRPRSRGRTTSASTARATRVGSPASRFRWTEGSSRWPTSSMR